MAQLENSEVVQAIINLTVTLKDFWPIVLRLSYFTGFVFVIASCFLAMNTQNRMMMQSSMGGLPSKTSMTVFIAGLLLLNVPGFLYHISDSIFRSSSLSVLSYQSLTTNVKQSGTLGTYITFAVAVVMFTGLLSILKGCIMVATSGDNPQAIGSALLRFIFGSLAVNGTLFMTHLGDTLGGSFKSNIDKFF